MDAQEKSKGAAARSRSIVFGDALRAVVREVGRARVVALGGSIELETADAFGAGLPDLVCPETPHLILDLAELEFISSIGISAIVAAHRRAKALRGSVQIVAPRAPIARLLELTRLCDLIPVRQTIAAALDGFERPN